MIERWSAEHEDRQFLLGTREYDWHSHLRGQLFCIESGLLHRKQAWYYRATHA
ncbi:hypothetical protein WAE56_08175 [Iodobacter sp. LRB]|uniref:hypothetical protein n=1 Tax=unclassified Iodobacter TaxID=235634 RepID=UPI001C557C9A|nr:hypothetical protein [Iodobacter sp. BJB302]